MELQTLTWGLWPSITSPQPTRWGPVTGGKPTDWLTPILSPVELNGLGRADLDAGEWNTEQALVGSLLASCCLCVSSATPDHPSLSPHLPASVALSIFHIISLLHCLCQDFVVVVDGGGVVKRRNCCREFNTNLVLMRQRIITT